MTQLVFVHGVATRSGDEYQTQVANRDRLIKEILFEGAAVQIHSPLWGDLVPAINKAVFGTAGEVQSFSIGAPPQGMGAGLAGGAAANNGDGVARVAQQNVTAALDAIFATLLEQADDEGRLLTNEDISTFRAATKALGESGASALATAKTDDELTFQLEKGIANTYGIGSKVKEAVSAVGDRLRNTVSTVAFDAVRDRLSPSVAMFLGDVFVYLKSGDLRESIRAEVKKAVLTGHLAAKAGGEPLILLGHSLGGVILCDILMDADLPEDLKVDVFLTVGSQPGLFQAMGAFDVKQPAQDKTSRPNSVANWLNVFDPIDPLAFRADPIFEGVEDLNFDSVAGLASAHTTYFKRPQFYARCRKRLQEAGVI